MSETKPARRTSLASRRRSERRKLRAMLLSVAVVGALAVAGTAAFLTDSPEGVVNTFEPSSVATKVTEDVQSDPAKKQSVAIGNIGDTAAYIRAAVVATWQDENGNVHGKAPVEGADYEIVFVELQQADPEGIWTESSDGFWYWSSPVAAGASTGVLIESCVYRANAPEGFFLNVEILGSGIQAEGEVSTTEVLDGSAGTAPVEIAWGVTLDDGSKTISKA